MKSDDLKLFVELPDGVPIRNAVLSGRDQYGNTTSMIIPVPDVNQLCWLSRAWYKLFSSRRKKIWKEVVEVKHE